MFITRPQTAPQIAPLTRSAHLPTFFLKLYNIFNFFSQLIKEKSGFLATNSQFYPKIPILTRKRGQKRQK